MEDNNRENFVSGYIYYKKLVIITKGAELAIFKNSDVCTAYNVSY